MQPVYWALRGERLTRASGDPAAVYWTDGPVPLGWGTNWTSEERAAFGSIPTGATWVCGLCGQGDPTSPDHICR